jgi:hypothetical protein
MSHYAKLAALVYRFVAVAGLFYSLPVLAMTARMAREPGVDGQTRLWAIAMMLLFPVIAIVLFLAARPLGAFTARGIE